MKTSSVYLAAALLSLNFKLENVDRKDPRHMVFEFAGVAHSGILGELVQGSLQEVEKQWANKTLQVNAFDYAEAIQRMKSIIHSS